MRMVSHLLTSVVNILHSHFGLVRNSFMGALHRLLNLPSLVELVYPRVVKVAAKLSPLTWTMVYRVMD